jgi:O-antigen/teichoic acid export membrane protein
VQKNLLANFLSQGFVPLCMLIGIGFYKSMMGLEAVGLVTFFAVLRSLANPLDAGLSLTLNRELARLSARPGGAGRMHDLLATTEVIFWIVAIAMGLGVAGGSGLIASHWLNPRSLDFDTVRLSLVLMGLALMLQWPFALYRGGLTGMQHQVALAKINLAAAGVGYLGVIPFMAATRATAPVFFAYQSVVHLGQTLAARTVLRRSLGPIERSCRFRFRLLKSSLGFAAGLTGITLTGLVITQADKLYLSKVLKLDNFADYGMIAVAAMALGKLFAPVFQAVQPRLTQLAHMPDAREKMRRLYHQGCQLVTVLLWPACLTAAAFSREILSFWLGADQGRRVDIPFAVLALAMGLNGLMMIPYALQLAHGWTRLLLFSNLAAIAIQLPALVLLVDRLGLAGAALAFAIPQVFYVTVTVPIMHRRLLRSDLGRWVFGDLLSPLVAAAAVVGACRLLWSPLPSGPALGIPLLAATWLLATGGAILGAGHLRRALFGMLRSARF